MSQRDDMQRRNKARLSKEDLIEDYIDVCRRLDRSADEAIELFEELEDTRAELAETMKRFLELEAAYDTLLELK